MASRPPPSFFSLILDTSATTLKISTEFVTKHFKNKIPKGPIIICANGGHSWRIKVRKIGENYYFDSGWANVVKDVHFMFGDFVLFRLDDKNTFKMYVYGKNSCERSLPKKVKVEDDDSSSIDNVAANVNVVNDDDVDDREDDDDDSEDDDDDDDDDDSEDDDEDDDVEDDVDEGKEEEEEEEEEDDDDDDVVDIDGDDGDPFFVSTISKAHKRNLRLPDEFLELAGIEDERSIMLKNLDGEEWQMELRPEKVNQSEKLYISSGWADFQESNDLREGDECVLKFISSEGKILLAKVTKKKRPTRQSQPSGESSKTEVVKRKRGRELHAHGRDLDVESEDEHGNDDDDEDEDSDEDEDVEGDNDDGNEGEEDDEEEEEENDGVDSDGNPFFTLTMLKGYKRTVRLPEEFVGLPGIEAYGTIMLKNLRGEEWPIRVLLDTSYKSERYLLSAGVVDFMRSNDILAGDKCIVKFIRSEGKLCLAKVTKRNRPARQPLPSSEILATTEAVKRNRGQPALEDLGDVNVKKEDECVEVLKRPCGEDHNEEDYCKDDDGQDNGVDNGKDTDNDGEDYKDGDVGDPSFSTIISKSHVLLLPEAFGGLPGIKDGGIIMLKNLTGEECPMGVRLNTRYQKLKRYLLSAGWTGFLRSNGILVGDECEFKFIRNEGKLCLTKVTKKNSSTRQAQRSGKILVTEAVKRKRRQSLREDLGDMDMENEDECVEVVKRPCVEGDCKEDDIDAGGGNIDGDVGDPSFTILIPIRLYLALPAEFVGLPGIKAGGSIMMKNLKGKEWSVGVRLNTAYPRPARYILTVGCREFLRDNNISDGDECEFKFIRNEGKLCLAKVTKKKRQLGRTPKSGGRVPVAEAVRRKGRHPRTTIEIPGTEVVKRKRGLSPAHKGGASKRLGRKKGQPQPPVVNRKRGLPSRDGAKNGDVEVEKRPHGRPHKRQRGKPRQ